MNTVYTMMKRCLRPRFHDIYPVFNVVIFHGKVGDPAAKAIVAAMNGTMEAHELPCEPFIGSNA